MDDELAMQTWDCNQSRDEGSLTVFLLGRVFVFGDWDVKGYSRKDEVDIDLYSSPSRRLRC